MLHLVVERVRDEKPLAVVHRCLEVARRPRLRGQLERRLSESALEFRPLSVRPVVELRLVQGEIRQERPLVQLHGTLQVAGFQAILELLHVQPDFAAEVEGVLDTLQVKVRAGLAQRVKELVESAARPLLLAIRPQHTEDLIAAIRPRFARHVDDQRQRLRPGRFPGERYPSHRDGRPAERSYLDHLYLVTLLHAPASRPPFAGSANLSICLDDDKLPPPGPIDKPALGRKDFCNLRYISPGPAAAFPLTAAT